MGGPLCSTRVGDTWIDLGTMCRSRSSAPGPVGISDVVAVTAAAATAGMNPLKAKFDGEHVYSKSREAARKRDIDLQIIGDDYRRSGEIRLDSADYLKALIRLGSNGKQSVSDHARKIQFFIVRGGGEGFLDPSLAVVDAGNFPVTSETTAHKKSTCRFDLNDVMAVFDPKGKLIGAAPLQRPISIPGRWTEKTANAVYNAWHNKEVAIYRNANFDVEYLGLVVEDGMKGRAWVDLHKQEATNGCIFIVDPDTPDYGTKELNNFEPRLLVDILASIGKRPEQVKGKIRLGIMHLVDIK
jgi:hypothetical protein